MNKTIIRMTSLKLIGLHVLAIAALAFAGCKTMEGAGEDVENAGEALQDAAR